MNNNIDQLKREKEELMEKIKKLEEELDLVKQELYKELSLHELDLKEFLKWYKSYEQLEKRYAALRNSFLGRITVKYWRLRNIIRSKGVIGRLWKKFNISLNK
jgi:chromosome segregation ATPase